MQKALDNPLGATAAQEDSETAAQATAPPFAAFDHSMTKYKHFKTEGEKKFDTHAYRFWGYYMNVLISLVAVWWVERTLKGQAFIRGFGEKIGAFGINKEWTEYFARKSFFLAGGFAVIPPIKWLENKKTELVKQYNRQIYGEKADSDPEIVQSEKEVAEAPKQTWKSVMSARLLALVPFYALYAFVWDANGWLVRWTNPNFKNMSGKAIRDYLKTNPVESSQGFYFDRPITWISRKLGKLFASVTGQTGAVARIGALEKETPGIMRSVLKPGCDPVHSAYPYYFISEAITSAMVAWGVYVITRVTGPFFGRSREDKQQLAAQRRAEKQGKQAAAPQQAPSPVLDEKPPEKKQDMPKPGTSVTLTGLERQQAAAPVALGFQPH